MSSTTASQTLDRDLIIIGCGPAGLTAALYAARAQLKPLVLVGQAFGGQVSSTEGMENYPGFPDGVDGMALTAQMARQATRFGAELAYEEATEVDLSGCPFTVRTERAQYAAKALIVCTGATPRELGVPGERRLRGHGVSSCATCDGNSFLDKSVVVVGGGDSALDEALYLTRFARQVTIVHRRGELRATPVLRERAASNPKICFVWDNVVDEVLGDETVVAVQVHNVKTSERSVLSCDGVFIYVGLIPNAEVLSGQLALTADGYVQTDKRQRTSVPGVFAAGDVQDPDFRQAVVAAGTGAAAAIEAERYLAQREFVEEQSGRTAIPVEQQP